MTKKVLIGAALILILVASLAAGGNLGTITAGSLNAVSITGGTITGTTITGGTAVFGTGGEVTLGSNGVTFTAGTGTNNKVKWSDGNAILSDSNSLQMSGLAGGTTYVRSNGDVALEAGLDSSGIVTLSGAGAPRVSNFSGLGSAQFVCHDNSGNLYSSSGTCDGSAPAPSAAHIAALEKEVAELRVLVQELASQR